MPAVPSKCLTALTLLVAQAAFAQDGAQNIDQAASDPTAPLMSMQVQDLYSPAVYNSDGTQNVLQFRMAIPFTLWGTQNIFRLTVPVFTETPSGATGISDTTVFDLVTFDRPWGRFGFGAVALLPTGVDGLSAEKWGLGPAEGFTVQQGKLLWGAFNQNIFSFAGNDAMPDVNLSILQPILNYGLGQGWSVGLSEMSATYDWNQNRWISLPLGAKLAKLHRFGQTPVQLAGSYEYNFADQAVAPKETISFTVKVLLPSG